MSHAQMKAHIVKVQAREHALRLKYKAETPSLKDQCRRLRATLRAIQQWDVLNPPRADLLADLPWLRKIVDDALAGKDDAT